jgi:hypothetical protein
MNTPGKIRDGFVGFFLFHLPKLEFSCAKKERCMVTTQKLHFSQNLSRMSFLLAGCAHQKTQTRLLNLHEKDKAHDRAFVKANAVGARGGRGNLHRRMQEDSGRSQVMERVPRNVLQGGVGEREGNR